MRNKGDTGTSFPNHRTVNQFKLGINTVAKYNLHQGQNHRCGFGWK